MPQAVCYEDDVAAWAVEQAGFLLARRFDLLDAEHLAEEIADVGKSEQRELAHRMALLLAHLLKWQYQPERRGASWRITIRNQRRGVVRCLKDAPSLTTRLRNSEWWNGVWDDAVAQAASETGLAHFPETCPWRAEEILDPEWLAE